MECWLQVDIWAQRRHRWFLFLVSIWLWFIVFLWAPIVWLYFVDDRGLIFLEKAWLLPVAGTCPWAVLSYTDRRVAIFQGLQKTWVSAGSPQEEVGLASILGYIQAAVLALSAQWPWKCGCLCSIPQDRVENCPHFKTGCL